MAKPNFSWQLVVIVVIITIAITIISMYGNSKNLELISGMVKTLATPSFAFIYHKWLHKPVMDIIKVFKNPA